MAVTPRRRMVNVQSLALRADGTAPLLLRDTLDRLVAHAHEVVVVDRHSPERLTRFRIRPGLDTDERHGQSSFIKEQDPRSSVGEGYRANTITIGI